MILEVKDLSFSYHQTKVLKGISFSVKEGELVGLLGPNGSGKTTVLKCIDRILEPGAGKVLVEGQDLKNLSHREVARYVSMVPQEHRAVFAYRVLDVVVMGITPYLPFGKVPGKAVYKKAREILERFRLGHLADKRYTEISGGEKQLVLIARALIQETPILLLDEPTAHLDYRNQYLLLKWIKELTGEGKSVVIAIHDPNLALTFCDQVILLKGGQMLARGDTRQVMTSSNLRQVYDFALEVKELAGGQPIVVPETDKIEGGKL